MSISIVRFVPFNLRKYMEDESGTSDSAILQWSIRAGYPRIDVYTGNVNLKAGADYSKMIKAALDYTTLNVILSRILEACASSTEVKYAFNCYNSEYVDNVKTGNVVLQARVTVGKDHAGVNYISVTEEGKKKVKFDILPSKWIKYFDEEGIEITNKKELSRLFAPEYIKLLRKCMEDHAKKDMSVGINIENKYTNNDSNKPITPKPNVIEQSKAVTTSVEKEDDYLNLDDVDLNY